MNFNKLSVNSSEISLVKIMFAVKNTSFHLSFLFFIHLYFSLPYYTDFQYNVDSFNVLSFKYRNALLDILKSYFWVNKSV